MWRVAWSVLVAIVAVVGAPVALAFVAVLLFGPPTLS